MLHLAMLYQYTNYGVESLQKILSITCTCIIAHHKFSDNEKKVNQSATMCLTSLFIQE